MKISFLVARRVPPVPSPVLSEASRLLTGRGFAVTTTIPEEVLARADALTADADLVVLKSHTELALSLAGALHGQGTPMLNPYDACVTAQDKITATRRLRAASVPVPRTWVTGDLHLAADLVDSAPLIIKPHRGHRGQGVHVVRSRGELAALPHSAGTVVVQEHIAGSGEDLKVYVVGEHVFAVRKAFSPDSFTRPGRPVRVSAQVADIARRCGRAFGLGLYGLDIIESPAGPVVVDVNYFPGYKGVPDVAPLIADYIAGYATGAVDLIAPASAA